MNIEKINETRIGIAESLVQEKALKREKEKEVLSINMDSKEKKFYSEDYFKIEKLIGKQKERTESLRDELIQDYSLHMKNEVIDRFSNIKKLKDMLVELENNYQFETTNLKIHDIASVCQSDDYFNMYTEIQFDAFQMDLDYHGVTINHIGRTSTIWLSDEDYNDIIETFTELPYNRNNQELRYANILEQVSGDGFDFLVNALLDGNTTVKDFVAYIFDESGFDEDDDPQDVIDDIEEWSKEIEMDIDEAIDYIELRLKPALENVKRMYEWIQDFKDNQLEYFEDFIINNEDDLEEVAPDLVKS